MLIAIDTGKPIKTIPYDAEYKKVLAKLTLQEIAAIRTELNSMIDGEEIKTAGWMPGNDWRGTPFQPIYEKAAAHNPDLAAKYFGLFVWEVFMNRPEEWASDHYEINGKPIKSRTYFRVVRP